MEEIRKIRLELKMTQEAFAKAINIPYRTYQAWESGVRVPPNYVLRMLRASINLLMDAPNSATK